MKFERITREGTSFLRLCDDEYNYSQGYYAACNWLDEDHILLARTKGIDFEHARNGFDFSHADYVLVDLKNETETVLIRDYVGHVQNTQGLIYGGEFFFFVGRDFIAQKLLTGERRVVLDGERAGISADHVPNEFCITADGRYVTMQAIPNERGPIGFYMVDTKTGEFEYHTIPPFAPPFWVADHVMVNPTDPSLVFFAHEGTTEYVSNRLWLWEKGKQPRPLVRQNLMENGNLRDCLGHESWAADGRGLYYIKYPVAGEPPFGIGYVSMQDGFDDPKILYSKYNYWHVCAAPDGKKLAADTIERESGVCLIDLETGEEKRLLHVGGTDRSHPTHPHPCFSPRATRLSFHDYCEVDGKPVSLGIGIIDL